MRRKALGISSNGLLERLEYQEDRPSLESRVRVVPSAPLTQIDIVDPAMNNLSRLWRDSVLLQTGGTVAVGLPNTQAELSTNFQPCLAFRHPNIMYLNSVLY